MNERGTMYTVMLVVTLLTGEVNSTPQISYKSLEACEAVQQYYRIAANKVIWNDGAFSSKVKKVEVSCLKQETNVVI